MKKKLILNLFLFLFASLFLFFTLGKDTAYAASSYTVSNGGVYKNGTQIILHGVNWSGADSPGHVFSGLDVRNFKDMVTQMKSVNINALRIPLCPATIHGSGVSGIDYGKNPDLQNLNSFGVLSKLLTELNNQQMYFFLDMHTIDCNSISELWYENGYTEANWISDMKYLATTFASLDYFMGIDPKNEPHGSATWGTGNAATDFNKAVERGGNAVNIANPNLLIFINGIGENPVCQDNTYAHFWGSNLEPQRCAPISTAMIPANKLVFSPHVYGPDVYLEPYFTAPDFPQNLPILWTQHFGFLADQGKTLVVGEWGGKYGNGGDQRDVTTQDYLVNYLISKKICNTFYWTWNPNSGDTGGLLKDDWNTLWSNKMTLLKKLYDNCLSAGPVGGPSDSPTPTPTTTPLPPSNTAYTGEYFNNKTLSGTPALTRYDTNINFDWGSSSPDPSITIDNFSARWTRNTSFEAGKYRFTVTADDGIRLYIDGTRVIDQWNDQAPATFIYDKDMTAGNHDIKIEYYENGGGATSKFSYTKLNTPTPPPGFTGFTGQYYNNRTLSGDPALTRFDNNINFDWGSGSPDPSVQSDNFSVRWTKTENFTAGNYTFTLTGDDGFRFYIDNTLVLDKWIDQGPTTYNITKNLTAGNHDLKLEYYENGGGAVIKLSYLKLADPTNTPTPTPTTPPTQTPVPPTNTPAPSANCSIAYNITNNWGSGFTAAVTIKNLTGQNINGWTLTWTNPSGQTLTDYWQGIFTKNGQNISVKNEWYNGNIPNNGTQSIGFNVNITGSFVKPNNFVLNGVACKVE